MTEVSRDGAREAPSEHDLEHHLYLQAYVDARAYEDAFAVARDLMALVEPAASVRECRVRPYPKFDDQFGVRLDLWAPDLPAAYDALLRRLAEGWVEQGSDEQERFAIWDARAGGAYPVAAARWLHLNVYVVDETPDGPT